MVDFPGQQLESKIRIVPDFPKEGIEFLDLTTLFRDAAAFKQVIDLLYDEYKDKKIEQVIGIESRGFVVASALAYRLGAGVGLIRKPGKLPAETISCRYDLEYGANEIHIHKDAVQKGERVLLIDDLLATGGTMAASIKLMEQIEGEIAGIAFVVELAFLNGMKKLGNYPVFTLIRRD